MVERITAAAPGKVILFGEHAVTLGEPAIAMAINRYARVTAERGRDNRVLIRCSDLGTTGWLGKPGGRIDPSLRPIAVVVQRVMSACGERQGLRIHVRSEIPVAVGLGSSAAVAVATALATSRLLGMELDKAKVSSIALEAEKVVHTHPSGIDNHVSTYGGIALFRMAEGASPLRMNDDLPLVVGNTGVKRSTGGLVRRVHELRGRFPAVVDSVVKAVGSISTCALDALERREFDRLGELMDLNHQLLVALGLSHRALERLIGAAKAAGALGAKLTGGGGGGCMVALAPGKTREVGLAIKNEGGTPMAVKVDRRGVRAWVGGG